MCSARLLPAAGCLALVVSACGSAHASGYHNPHYPYGAPNVPISISKCMRANGVPNFPDPREGPNGGGVGFPGGLMVLGNGSMEVDGIRLGGPALKSAIKTCSEYLPSGPPPVVSESQRLQDLADAACMRHHGLSNFPDPTFNSGQESLDLPPGINAQSPAFQQAAKACGLGGSASHF